MLPDATVLSARAAAKVTGCERGDRHVIARPVALGADPYSPITPPVGWGDPDVDLFPLAPNVAMPDRAAATPGMADGHQAAAVPHGASPRLPPLRLAGG